VDGSEQVEKLGRGQKNTFRNPYISRDIFQIPSPKTEIGKSRTDMMFSGKRFLVYFQSTFVIGIVSRKPQGKDFEHKG